ncbi:MAG: hypothetical protein AAGJ28_08170 [Pseudomonadota bacterium]
MARVLIITRGDFTNHWQGRFRRLVQVVDLYAGLGLQCDLLSVRPAPGSARHSASMRAGVLPDIRQAAVLEGDMNDELLHSPVGPLAKTVRAMAGSASYQVVHLDGMAARAVICPDSILVRDLDGRDGSVARMPGVDLVLAPTEPMRRRAGAGALRLPPAVLRGDALPGTMIGWPDIGDSGLADDWTRFLKALSWRAGDFTQNLLLSGPASERCTPPPTLLRRTLLKRDGTLSEVTGALGLGVFPRATLDGDNAAVTHLLSQNCPILIQSAAAEAFEGRWALPTADSFEELSDLIVGWANGSLRPHLQETLRQTADAFQDDVFSMTLYVGERLYKLLEWERVTGDFAAAV